jgi:hypothetical protein
MPRCTPIPSVLASNQDDLRRMADPAGIAVGADG